MSSKNKIDQRLEKLHSNLSREKKVLNLVFKDFLLRLKENPTLALRNIFQLSHDMIHYYIPEGVNEYPNDPESINYIHYDCSKLFVEGSENPFFVDRLLANRLINMVDSLKEGLVANKMLLFVGPPGSGKSTFLNNLLQKLEAYTHLDEGVMYETVWRLDVEKLGISFPPEPVNDEIPANKDKGGRNPFLPISKFDRHLIVPCPSHDHPIIQVPKQYRWDLLDGIIEDREFKKELFHHKEYKWVFKNTPCAICSSIYKALAEKLSPEEIFSMLYARHYHYSRKMGEGISVYNPGDDLEKKPLDNPELQKWLDALFKSSDAVSYLHSRLAKTNNGVFAIMDVKSNNIERMKNVHGIISDGIHKVGTVEESINSLFMTLINPEDIAVINKEKSFQDRVLNIPIPYVRDYSTEVEIYRNIYGQGINAHFLPRILTCFAKVVISTRLRTDSKTIKEWIKQPGDYSKFCDKNLLLLKMEIYTGNLPFWLSRGDIKRFNRRLRRGIIMEGDEEGRKGFSGRESIQIFNHFYFKHRNRDELIDMDAIIEFFKQDKYKTQIPNDFLEALVSLYDYTVLQEVKESMYYYNQEQISRDIQNYLFAINSELGVEVECPFTKDKLNLSEDYFKTIEFRLLKSEATQKDREKFRDDALRKYVSKTLQEIKAGQSLNETKQFQDLLDRYHQNLKQNVLDPFVHNDNFRHAIKEFSAPGFKKYDKRIREEVSLLMKNLKFKCNYTEKGAKQICLYMIDNNLVDKFAKS